MCELQLKYCLKTLILANESALTARKAVFAYHHKDEYCKSGLEALTGGLNMRFENE
jgi:hypothetical protein